MRYFKTPQASSYLEKLGIKRSPATLASLRTRGGGPRFARMGSEIFYCDEWIDQWVAEKMSPPVASTSELPQKAA